MKDFDAIILGIAVGGSALALILHLSGISPAQIEEKMKKQAISHGAAHYEVDTNGVVTFKWNK
jgi:flavin-dependent dehydrogenase